jgi:transcriptional regulator with XRE-family HTH domain
MTCTRIDMTDLEAERRRDWTASQVVAHNVSWARRLCGLTQVEVAERLKRFTGTNWTQTTVAQAEGSISGTRVRHFTANELVALARTFDLPVLFFFMPPEDERRGLGTPDSPPGGWRWEYLLMLVWGHRDNFPVMAERAAPWAHASSVLVPGADGLDDRPDDHRPVKVARSRERITPEDMQALAFNGLLRRCMRGPTQLGQEAQVLAANLRKLADAVEAFDTDPPATYFDPAELRELATRTQRAAG